MFCQVFTAKISKCLFWFFLPSSDLMQWELRDRSSEFKAPIQNPQRQHPPPVIIIIKKIKLPPPCLNPVLFLDRRDDPSLFPGQGTASSYICCPAAAAEPQSSLRALRSAEPSARCPLCVCVSLVPHAGPARCRGSADTPLHSIFTGSRRPPVPKSPSRPCPRYLRGGGRRAPLVERGGRPCARIERRAEAGDGQAGGPVRFLHAGPPRAGGERREANPAPPPRRRPRGGSGAR